MLLVHIDLNGKKRTADIKIVRSEPHTRLNNHYWYLYKASDDYGHCYIGKVLHNYANGQFSLVQKVAKAITTQQKNDTHKPAAHIAEMLKG